MFGFSRKKRNHQFGLIIQRQQNFPIRPLRWLIGAPELHHWHHDKNRLAGNYANLSPLMDLLFGTYHCPNHEPEEFGIREPIERSYLGQMMHPFLPKSKMKSITAERDS